MKYLQSFYTYPVTFSSIGKGIPSADADGELRNIAELSEKEIETLEMAELTWDTVIYLKPSPWLKMLTEDMSPGDKIGTVRRWKSDGKLHIKKEHGWEVLPNSKEYELKEYSDPKARKSVNESVTSQTEFDDFVDKLFNRDYKNAPTVIRLPKMNKGLLYSLGIKDNTQFIFKARYAHISPGRKAMENQSLTKEEYKQIPEAVKNAKYAYIDKKNNNFFIAFEDKNDFKKMNKIVFNKTTKGNYVVTVSKVNKKDDLVSREILPVKGRS